MYQLRLGACALLRTPFPDFCFRIGGHSIDRTVWYAVLPIFLPSPSVLLSSELAGDCRRAPGLADVLLAAERHRRRRSAGPTR